MTAQQEQRTPQQQALEWAMRLYADDLDPRAREAANSEFAQWLNSDESHRQAWRETEQSWQQIAAMRKHPQLQAWASHAQGNVHQANRLRPARQWRPMRIWPAVTAAAAALLVAVLLPLLWVEPSPDLRHYNTRVAEVKTFELPDGTQVILGARSAIAVDFNQQQRRVVLTAGDAFFNVGKDSQRPFRVEAGQLSVRVIGTQFDLHRGSREVRVGVLEGIVAVSAEPPTQAHSTAAAVQLQAGQQVSVIGNQLTAIQALDKEITGGWRQGRLSYNRARLAEVIADANRYSDKPITLVGSGLGELTLSTTYQTDQLSSMLKSLEAALPVVVEETPLGILIKPATRNSATIGGITN